MMAIVNQITSSSAAKILGVTPGRIRQLCFEHEIGSLLNSRTRILDDKDVSLLRSILDKLSEKKVGRPRKKDVESS